MNTALLPAITRFAMHFAADAAQDSTARDFTEPALCPDMMGTRCELHGRERLLGEAPLVPREVEDAAFDEIKHRRFPNSWMAIASHQRPSLFQRMRRARLVVVRYCPECREQAQAWLQND